MWIVKYDYDLDKSFLYNLKMLLTVVLTEYVKRGLTVDNIASLMLRDRKTVYKYLLWTNLKTRYQESRLSISRK